MHTFLGHATLRISHVAARPTDHRQAACMAKKKGTRCIITVECVEARPLGLTPSRYITQKNKKNTPGRLEIKKYNKYLNRMTLHREIK
jgi:large subunit ribosomal protein L33